MIRTERRILARFDRGPLVGDTPHPGRQHLTHDVIGRDLMLIGTHGPNAAPPDAGLGDDDHAPWSHALMVRVFCDLLTAGRMNVDDLVSHRFHLCDAPQTYDRLMASPAVRWKIDSQAAVVRY